MPAKSVNWSGLQRMAKRNGRLKFSLMGLRGSQERKTAWLIVAAAASEPSSLTSTTALCRTRDNFKCSPPSPPLPVIRLKSAASSNAVSMPIHRSVGFSSSEDSILKRGSDRVTFRAVILEYPLCRLRKSKKVKLIGGGSPTAGRKSNMLSR